MRTKEITKEKQPSRHDKEQRKKQMKAQSVPLFLLCGRYEVKRGKEQR